MARRSQRSTETPALLCAVCQKGISSVAELDLTGAVPAHPDCRRELPPQASTVDGSDE
jgi:hypothetical protein